MNALFDCSVVALLLWTANSILPEPGDRNPRLLCWLLAAIQPFGFVSLDKIKLWHPGYYTWIRSWFAIEKIEYDRFAWDVGTANWAGFDVANFPSRAFDSTEERNRMAELMVTWRTTGYSDSIDRGFQELGVEKFRQHPLRRFVLIPLLRMIHYWINIDGAGFSELKSVIGAVACEARPSPTVIDSRKSGRPRLSS
jgi:hypothetical protein